MDDEEETPEEDPPATGGAEVEESSARAEVSSFLTSFGASIDATVADLTGDEAGQVDAQRRLSRALDGTASATEEERTIAQSGEESVIENAEAREAARSFQEQCYLLYNWRKFADFNRDVAYRRFMKIHDGGNSPAEMLNAMTATPSLAEAVEELPAVYSSLVPKIRLYKSYQPTADLDAEEIDVEVKFDNFTSDVHELMVSEAAHRGQGAGIKSFEFKNTGNMPGAAVRSLEATLTLHLNSLSDLEVIRAHPRDNPTADEATLALLENVDPVRIIDLFTVSSSTGSDNAGHNPAHYRIKAVVGWETPRQAISGEQELEALREFTARTSHTFFLELTTHELDLKEDGTVGVSISYIATLENSLRSAQPGASDVLFGTLPPIDQQRIAQERINIAASREGMQEQVSQRGCEAQERSRMAGGNQEAQTEAAQEAREEATTADEEREEAIQAQENRHRMVLYQNFLETLIELHGLRYIDVEGEELGVVSRRLSWSDEVSSLASASLGLMDAIGLNPSVTRGAERAGLATSYDEAQADLSQGQVSEEEARRRRAERGGDMDIASRIKTVRYNLEHTGRAGNGALDDRSTFETTTTISGDNENPSVNEQALQGIRSATAASQDARVVELQAAQDANINDGIRGLGTALRNRGAAYHGTPEGLSQSMIMASDTPRVEAGKFRVFFIFLGDLLDAALSFIEATGTSKDLRRMRTLVGPTEFIDPATPERVRNYVNLADVPISWNELQKWFGREFIAADVLQISFSDFLAKATEGLLRSAFGPRCFESDTDGMVASSAVVTSNMFQLATTTDPFTQRVPEFPYGGGVVEFSAALFSHDTVAYTSDENSDYLFIFGQMRDPTSLIFDPTLHGGTRRSRDATKGIYHLRHGAAKGIVKRIAFKRKDDPQLRAANIARAAQTNSGTNRFRALRERYDANVSMLGNGLFKPGDYVYIDPTFWTHGSTPGSIIATNTTFKGYYSVLESSSSIESGKYETEIRCVYQADGETSEDYSGTRPRATANAACENTSPQSLGQNPTSPPAPPTPPSVSSAAGSEGAS